MQRSTLRPPARPVAALSLAAALLAASPAGAERTLRVEFEPIGEPQIAVWLETADGQYVDTLMVTRLVGSLGLGNRPGRGDFGGGLLFPYGRREEALPIWAHRRGVEYDRIVFQNCKEDWLGWHEIHSSPEPFYCRPVTQSEMTVDGLTCPSRNFRTDKGRALGQIPTNVAPECGELKRLSGERSVYPPRNDLTVYDQARDWAGTTDYARVNDLDSVSQATPRSGEPHRVLYALPDALAAGDFVVWIEVNTWYDFNPSHDYDYFVDPRLPDYGVKARGQPSLVWRLPIHLGGAAVEAFATSYAGYGAPDGQDGMLRPPDATITVGVPGSGTGRLAPQPSGSTPFQVAVRFDPETTCASPAPVTALAEVGLDPQWADLSFVSTATSMDQAMTYEIRYSQAPILSEADFVAANTGPIDAFESHDDEPIVRLDGLLPNTEYFVAVRTKNACGQPSELRTLRLRTPLREFTTVDACFVATAAWGHVDDTQVVTLRRFRDHHLLPHAAGRAFVDTYYALSPPIADAIRERPWARALTRAVLSPLVWAAEAAE